jgi:hypothetical protein
VITGVPMNEISALIGPRRGALPLSSCEVTICEPQTPHAKSTAALILVFPESRAIKKKFLLFARYVVWGILLHHPEWTKAPGLMLTPPVGLTCLNYQDHRVEVRYI